MGGGGWTDDPFAWRRVSPFKDCFELRAGRRVLARLVIRGLAITTAHVDMGRHRLMFEAEGIGSQRIAIHQTNEKELLVAKFDRRLGGHAGTLRFVDGGQLEWRRIGRWWKPTYVFADRFGNPLVRLRSDGAVAGYALGDEPESSVGASDDLILLLSLGWFLLITSGGAAAPGSLQSGGR